MSDLSGNVRVEYLRDSTADLMQPMGQGVASAFKAHYLKRTFEHILEATDGEDTAMIREFWRSYNIMDSVDTIGVAWEALRPATMNSAFSPRKLPDLTSHSFSKTLCPLPTPWPLKRLWKLMSASC